MNDSLDAKEREYKRISNKIRRRLSKLIPESVLSVCIEYLHKPDLLKAEKLQYIQPWWLLLLIKWTILESSGNNLKRKPLSLEGFRSLLNLQKELEEAKPTSPLDNQNGFMFVRQLAMQQFWFQEKGRYWLSRFARQSLLFGSVDKKSKIAQQFQIQTGITIDDYINLMIATISFYMVGNLPKASLISLDLVSFLSEGFGQERTEKFFQGISGDLASLRKYIQIKDEEHVKFPLGSEFYEETPLLRYPLRRVNKGFESYSPDVLLRSSETFVYDVLRGYNAEEFMQSFGGIFENYVENVIKMSKLQYLDEEKILKLLPPETKCVDFIIFENDSAILIDAKGVEMNFAARAAQRPGDIISATKASIMKGVKQSYTVVNNLSNDSIPQPVNLKNKKLYIIVITYKHLIAGNGNTFYKSVGRTEIDKLATENGDQYLVPIENMFFLAIDEFDLLIESYLDSQQSISNILDKVIEKNSNPINMSMMFSWSLGGIFPHLKSPRFLDEEIERLNETLK